MSKRSRARNRGRAGKNRAASQMAKRGRVMGDVEHIRTMRTGEGHKRQLWEALMYGALTGLTRHVKGEQGNG